VPSVAIFWHNYGNSEISEANFKLNQTEVSTKTQPGGKAELVDAS
jgi:hypothetical protein